jgi:PAS domain S-box-containing protein
MSDPILAEAQQAEPTQAVRQLSSMTLLALIGLGYFAAIKLALLLPDAEKILAVAWPAAGIGLAALLLNPRSLWPGILAVIFLVGNAGNLLSGRPLSNSLGFMLANVLESLCCALFIQRMCGKRVRFATAREIGALVAAAAVVNAGTAFLGAGTATLAGSLPFWAFWFTWWVADGLGLLLVTPLIVCWTQPGRSGAGLRYAAECTAFFLCWCLVSWMVFQPHDPHSALVPQPYMLVLLLAWPAFRMGMRTVTLALAALAVLAAVSPAVQAGPLLWGGADVPERLLFVQFFLASATATAFLLVTLITERRQGEQALRENQALLSAIIEGSPDAVYAMDTQGRIVLVNSAGAAMCGKTPQEIRGLDNTALFPPEEAARLTARNREIMAARRVTTVQEAVTLADGERHFFVSTRGPLLDADGEVAGLYGIATDVTQIKKAQEAVRESEERFRHAFEQAAVGFFHGGPDGSFLRVNQKFCDIVGYTREELVTLTFRDITHPDDLERDEAHLAALTSEPRRAVCSQKRYRRKDGSLVWVARTASPVCDDEGRVKYVQGVVEDITERKEAERKLFEREEQLRQFIDHSPAAIAVFDRDMRYLAASRRWSEQYGLGAAPLIGRSHYEVFPEIPERWREVHSRCLEGGVEEASEDLFVRQNGQRQWVSWAVRPWYGADGTVGGIAISSEDITERKAIEENLRRKNDMLSKTEAIAHIGSWAWDVDTDTVHWSEELFRIAGFDPALGAPPFAVQAPLYNRDDLDSLTLAAAETLRTGQPFELELHINRADGETRVCDGRGYLETKPGERPARMYGLLADITQRKRVEELREQIERTIRHDLRAPASSAIYLARLLRDAPGLTEQHRKLVDLFEQSGRCMLDTLNSTLDLFRIETGQYRFSPAPVDVLQLLLELKEMLRASGRRPDVDIRIVLPVSGARPVCLGQASLLRMALQNLLSNALDASPAGAEVEAVLEVGARCRVTLRNKGAVPAPIRERFFEKYVTLGKSGGTGIGTYSARLMVLAQGGEIAMRTSDEDDETVVTVELPVPGPESLSAARFAS